MDNNDLRRPALSGAREQQHPNDNARSSTSVASPRREGGGAAGPSRRLVADLRLVRRPSSRAEEDQHGAFSSLGPLEELVRRRLIVETGVGKMHTPPSESESYPCPLKNYD